MKCSLDPKFVSLNHNNTSQHWSLQGGYTTNDEDVYPRRVFGVGLKSGMNVGLVNDKSSSNNTCLESENGYKVVLHSPGDIPRITDQTLIVPMILQEYKITVKPSIITTSEGLRNYSPERRQCFYEDERYLKFFKVYTQSNCELECLTNYTLKACGCVKFSMPRDKNTSICNFERIKCFKEAELDFITKKSFDILMPKKILKEIECNCMPSCTSIKYDYEFIKQSELVARYSVYLNVKFIESKVPTTVRSELFGLFEFIGNCGGLMGLFMGVSFLSVIELIYYFTLRLACNLGCRRKHPKTSPSTIVVDEATEVNINSSQTQIESPENGQFMN